MCGPPMASSLTSYTEVYDVEVEHAYKRGKLPSSLYDTPFLPVSS